MRLLDITEADQARWHREYLAGDRSRKPGMVRISVGAYNVTEDIDALVATLRRIAEGLQGQPNPENGDYRAVGDCGTDPIALVQ